MAAWILKKRPMAESNKLLVGLFPAREVQAEIEAHRKNWWWPRGCSFPPVDRLHLTLQYLPDQQGNAEQRLRAALAEVSMQPLQLTLDRSCTWSNDASVVQPSEHEDLRRLQYDISRALVRAGFSLDVHVRGWTPHVTIARDAERAARPTSLKPIRWTATEFRLVRSHFTYPFRHEPLGSYPLH
ncbi:2'-5' RNA ligase [Variovorax sp. YR634]|uniref:2'-5' RNA ligase family protein n=2 Tax=unclassified Variovorax TaxID=663243 RepID=UPI000898E38D|nr:2'-5' RNA ligase family protein [Variovorax sp. YR634]SDX86924.1 2'-5' RNA ligase [Variovorax sp. YR634]